MREKIMVETELKELEESKDSIKKVQIDKQGRCTRVIFKDENSLDFSDFIELFKMYLRTIIAGQVISWDDVWRFQRQTDARGMEEYLDNVEQEGIMKGSRFTFSRQQKMSLGALIIIIIVIAFAFVILTSGIQTGGP
jgi:hypothetical protein